MMDQIRTSEIKDKLEYLFEMQNSLITQDYNSTKIKSSEKIPLDNNPENKMKKLYKDERTIFRIQNIYDFVCLGARSHRTSEGN